MRKKIYTKRIKMAACLLVQPNAEEVWRKDRGAVKDRLSYFVGNEFLADVTFVVGVGEGKRSIPGHRFILSTCSWDFYNVTYLLQLDNNEIPIPDVSCDAFLLFLKYCYTGEIRFAEEEKQFALPVLKLAYRFSMEHLVEICEDQICEWINATTWSVWAESFTFLPEESKLRQALLTTFAENFAYFMQNESNLKRFSELPRETVREIVSCDPLDCNEMEVFDALMKWATEYCEKRNISPQPLHLRAVLKDVFYKIRFPTMEHSWFTQVLAKYPNLLTAKEISEISLKMNGMTLMCENFPCVPRKMIRITRSAIEISHFPRNLENYYVQPCFSEALKIEGSSRHFSIYFKIISHSRQSITGFGVLVNRDQELNLRYYRILYSSEKGYLEPTDSGQYYKPEDARPVDLIKRYHINSAYDMVFFKRKNWGISEPNKWLRFSCEFDVDLPRTYPAPYAENIGNLLVKNEKTSFIPYLSFTNEI